jgi:hypothetical protein
MQQARPTPSSPTAQCGDVLFSRSGEKSSSISCLLQVALLDPLAKNASHWFSHVAIAIDSSFALEAVPGDEPSSGVAPQPERGPWSGVALDSGVRLIPLADIFIPAWANRTKLTVLRHCQGEALSKEHFLLTSPQISDVLGSAYSIQTLKRSVESTIRFDLPTMVKDKLFNWSSRPEDLATKMGVDAELRAKIEKDLPNYVLKLKSRTYFCSQLVASLLKVAGMLTTTDNLDQVTPTGLYNLLIRRSAEWSDVTESDYSTEAVEFASRLPVISCQADYYQSLALLKALIQPSKALAQASEVASEYIKEMNSFCDATTKNLEKMWRPSSKVGGAPSHEKKSGGR